MYILYTLSTLDWGLKNRIASILAIVVGDVLLLKATKTKIYVCILNNQVFELETFSKEVIAS